MKNILVTGSTGFVGRHILEALRETDHKVKVLIRDQNSFAKLPFTEGLSIYYGDVTNYETLKEPFDDTDTVIHLVGIIREFPRDGISFEKLHHRATANIVSAAKEAGVKRIIFMSANGANENGVTKYQTTKKAAEQEVIDSGIDWTIFRPSVIFGDSDGLMEFTSELANVIATAPVMPIFGDGLYKLDPVAVEDVAQAFVKSIDEPKAIGATFHLGGGAPLTFYEIVQTIGKALGRTRTRTVNVPFGLIKPAAALLGNIKNFPVTTDQLAMLQQGNVCPEHEWRGLFGIEPKAFTHQNLGYLKK